MDCGNTSTASREKEGLDKQRQQKAPTQQQTKKNGRNKNKHTKPKITPAKHKNEELVHHK